MPKVHIFEDTMVCVEMIYQNGDIPFERLYLGNLDDLKQVLSDGHCKELAEKVNADSAYVQNMYFRSKSNGGKLRSEFRIGSQASHDIESFISEEEE